MKNLKAYLDVRNQLLNFLREDVGSGDITSESIIPSNTSALAHIICKSKKKAIVSGLYECGILFGEICKCDTKILVEDGSTVNEGNVVMQVRGKAEIYTTGRKDCPQYNDENEWNFYSNK